MLPAASSSFLVDADRVISQERQNRRMGVYVSRNAHSTIADGSMNIHIKTGITMAADQAVLSIANLDVADATARRAMAARPPATKNVRQENICPLKFRQTIITNKFKSADFVTNRNIRKNTTESKTSTEIDHIGPSKLLPCWKP